MPLWPWVIPAAKAAAPWLAQAGLSWINDRFQNNQRKELAKYEFKKNKEMWELNNQYNTPLAQMNRFKAAGLNPALMYGQGTPGNSQSAPKYEAPQYDSKLNFPNPLETLAQTQNIETQKAQLQNIKQTNDLIQAQTGKAIADSTVAAKKAGLLDLDTLIRRAQSQYAETLAKTQSDTATEVLNNTRTQGKILEFERQIKSVEAQLRKDGFSPNDPAYIRLIGMEVHKLQAEAEALGLTPSQLGERLRNWIQKLAPEGSNNNIITGYD